MKLILSALLRIIVALGLCGGAAAGQYVTLAGSLQASNGMPAANYIVSFQPSQFGFISGTGVVVNTGTYCATSTDGSVVGLPNPLQAPSVTVGFSGTLTPANYYVKIAYYDASGNLTLVSPETVIQLNSTGQLIVASPSSGLPAGASGMKVYIAASTNAETLQGQTTGSAAFIQSTPLTSGATPPSSNATICKQVANDAMWPSGTGYTVALTDPGGNTIPGYPMMWQLMGPNTTINLSSGLPYYHGTVYFPTPILATPLNHAGQTISGPLGLSGYDLTNVGAIGVGTNNPAWPIDVENGAINASGGFILNGGSGVTAGVCLAAGTDAFHTFDATSPCLTSAYYQTVDSNGTPMMQRAVLNFDSTLAATDSSSPARTNVGLPNKVTAGTYAQPTSITVDAQGRTTAITSGGGTTPVNLTCTGTVTNFGCYRISSDGTIQEFGVFPAATAGGTVSGTNPLSYPFPFGTLVSVTAGAGNGPDGTNNDTLTIYTTPTGTPLTTANFVLRCADNIGGTGCPNISNAVPINWQAIGK